MLKLIAGLLAALQLCTSPAASLPMRLRSGEWLRFHVITQDDTAEMQRIKLCVRDAVQECYLRQRSSGDMLRQAEALLPELRAAAEATALAEGFTDRVDVSLGRYAFDERELLGMTVPAGEYPALMIRLGDAKGHNWWGLLDPELALQFAQVREEEPSEGPVIWDWSWQALLSALFGLPMPAEGA
ncbi:MAG: stage II sporulation protein R [Aristaeellaceae bacterium]